MNEEKKPGRPRTGQAKTGLEKTRALYALDKAAILNAAPGAEGLNWRQCLRALSMTCCSHEQKHAALLKALEIHQATGKAHQPPDM